MLPSVGRVGPIKAQVIHRDPSGGIALRLPNLQDEAGAQMQQAMDSLDKLIPVLASMNKVVSKEQFDALQERIEELEAQLNDAEKERERLEAQIQAGVPMAPSTGTAPVATQARTGRGFAVPDVRDLEPAIQGNLGDRTFRDAIIQLSIARLTGLMTVQYPDGKYGTDFGSKAVLLAGERTPSKNLKYSECCYTRQVKSPKKQLAQSLEMMGEKDVGKAKPSSKWVLMSFTQLTMVLGKQVEYLLQHVMRSTEGQWGISYFGRPA